jgi:hypothetical protein
MQIQLPDENAEIEPAPTTASGRTGQKSSP